MTEFRGLNGLEITDLFCGAGGSGIGAAAAGFKLRIAANHWAKAIETHALNFPDTEHDCADISQVDPRRYPPTDVLWASPECTNHSQAKGIRRSDREPDSNGETLPRDAAERSRATMWDVPRFVEAMLLRGKPYRAVIVENVVEAAKWIPFRPWLASMEALGYNYILVSLNSMFAPAQSAPRAPQSRDRLYIVFYRHGQRKPDVIHRPLGRCVKCGEVVACVQAWKNGRTVGRYRAQYVYACPDCWVIVEPFVLPAAAAIDWSLPGQRIGDRAKPLSPKTMARIEAGLIKYGRAMTFEARGNTFVRFDENGVPRYARAWPVDQPTATFTTTETRALVVPLEGRDGKHALPDSEPLRTQTARHQDGLLIPYYRTGVAHPTSEPMLTVTTRDRDALVVPAGGTWNDTAYPADEPLRSFTTREAQGVAFLAELRGMEGGHNRHLRDPLVDPMSAVSAGGNHHMLVRHNTARGNPAQMCTPASEPMRTLTTTGHQSLVSIERMIEDATFRMLDVHEIQAGMAFTPGYELVGTRRERVRQLGNGVTPPAAEFLLLAVAASLGEAA